MRAYYGFAGLALMAASGVCQPAPPHAYDGTPAERAFARGTPIGKSIFQSFFREVGGLGVQPLTEEARYALRLSDEELHSLVAITADLAVQSRFFGQQMRPLAFEAVMETAESGEVSPALRQKMRELEAQWDQKVDEHALRLKAAYGETRFRVVEDWVRSGKSMFEGTAKKRSQ